MKLFVTLDEAKGHLRIDDEEGNSEGQPGDADLELKMHAASSAVRNYLKSDAKLYEFEEDSNGDVVVDSDGTPVIATNSDGPIVRAEIKAATLLMLGYLYKDRDNDERHEYEMGYLPRPVMALLYPLRDPALR